MRECYRAVSVFVMLVTTWALVGGCRKPVEEIDTTPFENAVHTYLKAKSMELRVAEVKSISVKEDAAEATISLEHAGEAVGPKVQWKFWFAQKDGAWLVTQHKQ